jgi:hypothetical protein
MNQSPIAEKIIFLQINDQKIEVENLPKEIRFEVETLQRYSQKKLDLFGEMEIIELAILAKRSQINDILKGLYPTKTEEPDSQNNETSST